MATLFGPVRPDLIRDEYLHQIFLSTAQRFPAKVALRWQNEEITYKQLSDRASKLARKLRREKQIGPGDIVGIRLSRSAQLHVTIIAVLMTGATYVPFDADTPAERVSEVLTDLQANFLLVDSSSMIDHSSTVNVETWIENEENNDEIDDLHVEIPSDCPAYIISTSGSTGKPKSIGISHRSICHLLRADNELMKIEHDDIIYQGCSPAFDMFFEETFLAYLMGATLVIASKSDVINTDRLHFFFIQHSITVLFCVPTLLLLMTNDSQLKLRLINTGGEACPQTLVDRWWKEDRLIFNSYGPTETTVSATVTLLRPGEPISIGSPLPNYVCCLLDETTGELTSSSTGELCINGPGLALGYIARQSFTKEKFTRNGYRTGDRVTFNEGKIYFHQRIDSQVKVRGFRMELDEIEEEFLRLTDEVQSAAVVVFNDQLIAFIVGSLNECEMRERLSKRLPRYMLPDRLIHLKETMPRLISGKIDRKQLIHLIDKENQFQPKIFETRIDFGEDKFFPSKSDSNILQIILNVFQMNFSHRNPRENDDFFLDLGGHSFIAATTINKLREYFPDIALQDLYQCKTAANLAQRLEQRQFNTPMKTNDLVLVQTIEYTWIRTILCSLIQLLVLILVFGVASLDLLLPYLIFHETSSRFGLAFAYLFAYGIFVIVPIFREILSIVMKWIVIGRYEPGDFPLWSSMYLRWWTVEQFKDLSMSIHLAHSPLMNYYYSFLGAKIGRNVHLGRIHCSAPDLLEIDDETTISSDVSFQNAFVEDSILKFRRISVGKDVFIGGNCVISGEVHLEDHVEISDMSFIPRETRIPSGEAWRGSPAIYWRRVVSSSSPPEKTSMWKRFEKAIFSLIFGLLIVFLIPLFYYLPMIPGLTLFEYVHHPAISHCFQILLFSPAAGILYTSLVIIEILVTHLFLAQKMKEGVYSVNSLIFIRKWICDKLSEISLHVIHTFYGTLYVSPFLRALGMKIGHRCEISTAVGMIPSLVEIGDECFLADNVILGDSHIQRGQIHLRKTIIDDRVFIGNSAVISDGIRIANNCLIGCSSLVVQGIKEGQSSFGSPPFLLPKRAKTIDHSSEKLTYHPPIHLVFARFSIDTIRIFFPRILIVLEIGIAIEIFDIISHSIGFGLSLLTLPILYLLIIAFPSLFICLILKWLLMGKYKKHHYPMWTCFVWTSELVTAMYEQLAVPFLLGYLRGTFFLSPILRCFGVQIGRGCFINTTDLTEFDLVHIGDYVNLNSAVILQTHLFEDRIMKVDHVFVDNQSTIGCASVILPNTRISHSVKLGPLSLVMRGESIPPQTSWQGIPIQTY